jgi:hypothetical protein
VGPSSAGPCDVLLDAHVETKLLVSISPAVSNSWVSGSLGQRVKASQFDEHFCDSPRREG